jgi:hypothetical protein
MPQVLNQFQMYEAQAWSGLTTKNHLYKIYQAKPQKASDIMRRIHVTNYGMDLDSLLSKYGSKTLETNDDFTWELMGSGKKNLPLLEARLTPSGAAVVAGDQPGLGVSEFYMVFAEKIFTDKHIIVGHKNELYQVQIQDDPVPDGTNWLYAVKLITNSPDNFVPVEELAPGKRWSRDWSLVEDTLSTKGGGIHFESPFGMRNSFSMIRMQHTVAGNMKYRPFATKFAVPEIMNGKDTGKTKEFTTWLQYEDYEFDRQFREEKNKLMMFARSNRGVDGQYYNFGNSGHILRQGAGIRQQMESSGTEFYSTFTIDFLLDVLMDLSEGKLPTDQRHFIAQTGERGATQFHRALENQSQLFTPSRETQRIFASKEKGGMAGAQMGMGWGGQFLEYIGPNGIKFTISVNSMYDDRERNKIMHPNGGVAESYRYDIFDIGTTNGVPNVQKFYAKGSEDIWGYQPGLRDPFSPEGKPSIMSHTNDGWTMHRACEVGTAVYDPTRTKSLLPNILY